MNWRFARCQQRNSSGRNSRQRIVSGGEGEATNLFAAVRRGWRGISRDQASRSKRFTACRRAQKEAPLSVSPLTLLDVRLALTSGAKADISSAASWPRRTCARTFEDDHLSRCDHRKAIGPSRTPDASSANNADHPSGRPGPPAASSATPAPQPPSAERPNPTVECSARVAPR